MGCIAVEGARMKFRTGVIAMIAAVSLCGLAAAQTEPAPADAPAEAPAVAPALPPGENASLDPSDAPAGAYALDERHGSVIWRVRHQSLGLFTGRFDKMAGTIQFDPENPANSTLDVSVEANSVSTNVYTDPGERRFDGQISDVLGADDQPLIRFVSRAVTVTGPATGLIEGDLTMNGQTHPAVFEATFQGGRSVLIPRGGKYVLAFSGRAIINRREWSVGSALINQFAGDLVEILVDGEFVRE